MAGITHKQAQEAPERYRILSNGAIYDMQDKRIRGNPGGGETAITQASASEMSKLRVARAREAFVTGLIEGTGVRPQDGDARAWQEVGKKAGELIQAAKSPRGFSDLAKFVGQAGAYMGDNGSNSGQDTSNEEIKDALVALLDAFTLKITNNYQKHTDVVRLDSDLVGSDTAIIEGKVEE